MVTDFVKECATLFHNGDEGTTSSNIIYCKKLSIMVCRDVQEVLNLALSIKYCQWLYLKNFYFLL
jgi:hypothetical protein